MDEIYDCKQVTSPCPITKEQKQSFERIGLHLAELIDLHGVMDVEVIDDQGILKVLEIDARIPSQTPTVVYHSSGMNLLRELADVTLYGKFTMPQGDLGKYCSYEHFKVNGKGFFPGGEHIMCQAGPLKFKRNFFGADEALTDYDMEKDQWYGTFINWADTEAELNTKRATMIQMLEEFTSLDHDPIKNPQDEEVA
jgi:pyrrolysine biosynthesis protein PylC